MFWGGRRQLPSTVVSLLRRIAVPVCWQRRQRNSFTKAKSRVSLMPEHDPHPHPHGRAGQEWRYLKWSACCLPSPLSHTVPASLSLSLSLSSLQFNLQLIVAQLQRQRSCAHCEFINEATHMSSDVGSIGGSSNSDVDSDALLSVVWVMDVSCGRRAKSFHRAFVELCAFVGVIFSCSSLTLTQKLTGFARNFSTNQRFIHIIALQQVLPRVALGPCSIQWAALVQCAARDRDQAVCVGRTTPWHTY